MGREFKVALPEDKFAGIEFKKSMFKHGIGIINVALNGFEPKGAFEWYVEILCKIEKTRFNGLPTESELKVLYESEDILDSVVKGPDKNHPNGVFVGHLICDKVMTLMWMVNNPEETNNRLQEYMSTGKYLRHFQYCIEKDADWKKISHFLK